MECTREKENNNKKAATIARARAVYLFHNIPHASTQTQTHQPLTLLSLKVNLDFRSNEQNEEKFPFAEWSSGGAVYTAAVCVNVFVHSTVNNVMEAL